MVKHVLELGHEIDFRRVPHQRKYKNMHESERWLEYKRAIWGWRWGMDMEGNKNTGRKECNEKPALSTALRWPRLVDRNIADNVYI